MTDELRDAVMNAISIFKDSCRDSPDETLARADQLHLFMLHDELEREIKRRNGIKRMAAALMGKQ